MTPLVLIERFGPVLGRFLFWLILVLLLLFLGTVAKCTLDRGKKAETVLIRNQTGAAQASGRDAVDTVGQQAASENVIDRATRDNQDEIRSAAGANEPIALPVNDAGLRALCKRASYRKHAECLQRVAP